MDQGVIANTKLHYKKLLLRDRIEKIDGNYDTKIELFDAMKFLEKAWETVSPETISRCFKKAKFFDQDLNLQRENEEDLLVDIFPHLTLFF